MAGEGRGSTVGARKRPGRATPYQTKFQGLSAETQLILNRAGEAGRFEFKEVAQALTVRHIAAAANAAAMEGLAAVTVLVGVGEQLDPATGAVKGKVLGLKSIERAKSSIRDRGATTLPVPVRMELFEENLGTARPILRVRIAPTRPPHYDGEGTRATRYGGSTRAITDEELVGMYLDREAGAFRARFETATEPILDRIGDVSAGLEHARASLGRITQGLDNIDWQAQDAADAAGEGRDLLKEVYGLIEGIAVEVAGIGDPDLKSMEEAWPYFRTVRRQALLYFETVRKKPAEEAGAVLAKAARSHPAFLDYPRVVAETEAWSGLLAVKPNAPGDEWLAAANRIAESQRPGDSDLDEMTAVRPIAGALRGLRAERDT